MIAIVIKKLKLISISISVYIVSCTVAMAQTNQHSNRTKFLEILKIHHLTLKDTITFCNTFHINGNLIMQNDSVAIYNNATIVCIEDKGFIDFDASVKLQTKDSTLFYLTHSQEIFDLKKNTPESTSTGWCLCSIINHGSSIIFIRKDVKSDELYKWYSDINRNKPMTP